MLVNLTEVRHIASLSSFVLLFGFGCPLIDMQVSGNPKLENLLYWNCLSNQAYILMTEVGLIPTFYMIQDWF